MPIKAQSSFMAIKSLVKLFETCKLTPALRDKSSQEWFVPFLFSGILFDRTAIAANMELLS